MAYRDGAQAMIAFPHTSWAFVLIWRTILIDCSPKKNETGHFQSMPGILEHSSPSDRKPKIYSQRVCRSQSTRMRYSLEAVLHLSSST